MGRACQITLSDFSPGMLQEARQNLAGSPQSFSFQVIDAQSIPLDAGSCDCVIANHMLYHVPDRLYAFKPAILYCRGGATSTFTNDRRSGTGGERSYPYHE